jgi:hypothetical protein
MIYYRIVNKSKTTAAIARAGTDYLPLLEQELITFPENSS